MDVRIPYFLVSLLPYFLISILSYFLTSLLCYNLTMLAKKTAKNQVTLPKVVVARFGDVEYFDVSTDGECIILRPLQRSRAEEVRAKLAELGMEEAEAETAFNGRAKSCEHSE